MSATQPRASIDYVGHGTVLVDLAGVKLLTDPLLRNRVTHSPERGDVVSEHLRLAAAESMQKGEALVCHVVGRGEDARLVDVERIDS